MGAASPGPGPPPQIWYAPPLLGSPQALLPDRRRLVDKLLDQPFHLRHQPLVVDSGGGAGKAAVDPAHPTVAAARSSAMR